MLTTTETKTSRELLRESDDARDAATLARAQLAMWATLAARPGDGAKIATLDDDELTDLLSSDPVRQRRILDAMPVVAGHWD
ncbi:hypothetical protein [Isoptericola croceus]|uniref:hypothetical protein n=1 Tax=Isoptericola croceus TaxID=3031406 RepID=UPI0023F88033|nr:hypothetical protein [Isoptericola croceus]